MSIKISDHFTYKKLFRFVLPSIAMMIFTSIYGVVDGLFVSNFVGNTAFASINLVMPFIMILGGMGFMIGSGGTALVAKTLGEGDRERANKYFSMLVQFTVIFGLLLTVVGIVFMRPISYFLGATEGMIEDCVIYGRIVIGFTTAFMLQNIFQSFFIAAEKPKLGLYATIGAGVTNMVLDALFIAVFKWGVAGAALATGVSQCVGGVFPLVYFIKENSSLLRLKFTAVRFKPIFNACINGSSELMNNVSSSIVSMLFNFQLMEYIGENGVSAYGVLMYVQFIFIAIFIGYSIGISPIVGYNYGAEATGELKNILKKSVIFMSTSGVVLTVLAMILSGPMAAIFVGYNKELYELTQRAFMIFAPSFLFAGFNILVSGFFTSLNNGAISAAVAFFRTLVFQSASIIILPTIIGEDGIWLSMIVAEIFAFVISLLFLVAKRKKYRYY
ncbi:MAG: MATE family efflux transporter [Ruminococcaceae bacterium]|nr:MATE family efflux transporter [Oscillospiraceae bacterium]